VFLSHSFGPKNANRIFGKINTFSLILKSETHFSYPSMKNIAVFASGAGSNAENIIRHFCNSPAGVVRTVFTNNPAAGVIERAAKLGVECVLFSRAEFSDGAAPVLRQLAERKIDFIVLAGFLWLVPAAVIEAYRGRIINIHPALLPRYGGKGMYGDRVHAAVVEARERESGITIHHVNEIYDSGDIIAQYRVALAPDDTPADVAHKVHCLEYEHFPQEIEKIMIND